MGISYIVWRSGEWQWGSVKDFARRQYRRQSLNRNMGKVLGNTEFAPLEYYFAEGKRQWKQTPKLVTSRAFYELWEKVYRPKAFGIDKPFRVAGTILRLPSSMELLCGHTEWSEVHHCATLIVEGGTWSKTFLLRFCDGEPAIEELPTVSLDRTHSRQQETLELISEVIVWIRRKFPQIDILKMKRREFLAFLPECSDGYATGTVNLVRRMSKPVLQEHVRRMLADWTTDELNQQMTLPLEGHYAVPQPNWSVENELPPDCRVYRKTHWEVYRTVAFLAEISSTALAYARQFEFSLVAAEFCSSAKKNTAVIRIPVQSEVPVEEADRFSIFDSDGTPCGLFSVEVVCRTFFYGNLTSEALECIMQKPQEFSARLQKSPRFHTSEAIRLLERDLALGIVKEAGAMAWLIGLKECPFRIPDLGAADGPAGLSPSQKHAWMAATCVDNPLVLIQGPPGTGKTFVLEQVLRTLMAQGLNVLVSAPSNAAVDNICRHLFDLPVLRCGNHVLNIAPDVAARQWSGSPENQSRFQSLREQQGGGSIVAGTHFGILQDESVKNQVCQKGLYDAVLFDEAGMSSLEELLLCTRLGKRAILFGDHRQLQPFPLRSQIVKTLREKRQVITREEEVILNRSSMEWLAEFRSFPVVMLTESFRCQNPRLLRFASLLFYNAEVSPALNAEYYHLPFRERLAQYPPETMTFYTTSNLSANLRQESLSFGGSKPGLSNETEAVICCFLFYCLLRNYPPEQISIIAPYRKQIRRIRALLSPEHARLIRPCLTSRRWEEFLNSHIATVDSFQGAESDAVIISYVRSNENHMIGFSDNPNRVNVAHTRCRKELYVVGDLNCLKRGAGSGIFDQMERAFRRDGRIISLTESELKQMQREIGLKSIGKMSEWVRTTSSLSE